MHRLGDSGGHCLAGPAATPVGGSRAQAASPHRKAPLYWDDAFLVNAALDIHADDPAFGYRFIADELPAHGITTSPNRVDLPDHFGVNVDLACRQFTADTT
ncbi:hypothetical protein A6A27_33885 [Micromonospora sp. CB01531]|nr:hypothetical protein A6A27_33885 [Micromonospora sp. CB01531]